MKGGQSFASGLTDEQLVIVNHPGDHARVSAVAGSGKTTTMVARVGRLLQLGARADTILVLMFNRSARDSFSHSMKRRLSGFTCSLPEIRTFHSLGLRLVNSFVRRGVLPEGRLVTEDYVAERLARQVANQVWRQENGEEGWLAGEEITDFLTYIDLVKASVVPAADVFERLDLPVRYRYFVAAYDLFEETRKSQRIRFYNDLIHDPLMAMISDSSLTDWVGDRVDHIIVDEYQDINEAQQKLLKIIAGKRAKVMVVGDVDQCIYEWRGARPEYITELFQTDFPAPANYLLSYTFRFGHQLSLAANHVIGNNTMRDRKLCISHASTGATTFCCLAEGAQGDHPVVTELRKWLQQGRMLREGAVLVRLYAQAVPVELALLEEGIPYRLEGSSQVFANPEILALSGYLHLADSGLEGVERESREAMLQAMLSQPHMGIKTEVLQKLAAEIAEHPPAAEMVLRAYGDDGLPPFLQKRFTDTAQNWHWLRHSGSSGAAYLRLNEIEVKFGLFDFYRSFSARAAVAENRIKTCQAFIDFAKGKGLSVRQLLDKLAHFCRIAADENADSLLITSIHRAKGLEWPLVIIPGLEEGAFPFYHEQKGGDLYLEDERRLFYVAITRARERGVCVHPADASLARSVKNGSSRMPKVVEGRASRFLFEANPGLSIRLGILLDQDQRQDVETCMARDIGIGRQYLQAIGAEIGLVETGSGEQRQERPANRLHINDIAVGMMVWHPVIGSGVVTAIQDRQQGRLTVSFKDEGEMVLLAAYARLEPL